MTLAALKAQKLLGTAETVPSFRDLLDQVQGHVPLVVEIKKDKGQEIGPLETSVARMLQHYSGPFVVQSFNPRTLQWFQKHAPEIVPGQLDTNLATITKCITCFPRQQLKRARMNGYSQPEFLP